jgi:hypothetical protein
MMDDSRNWHLDIEIYVGFVWTIYPSELSTFLFLFTNMPRNVSDLFSFILIVNLISGWMLLRCVCRTRLAMGPYHEGYIHIYGTVGWFQWSCTYK